MHWRHELVIDWILLITLEVTKITHEDPFFISNLRKACFAFIKNDPAYPLQRIAPGIIAHIVTICTLKSKTVPL